jgi:hypothetical protein
MREIATMFPCLYVTRHTGLWELQRILVAPDARDKTQFRINEDEHRIFTNQMKEFKFI